MITITDIFIRESLPVIMADKITRMNTIFKMVYVDTQCQKFLTYSQTQIRYKPLFFVDMECALIGREGA